MSINLKEIFSNLSSEDQAKAMLIKTPEELADFTSTRGMAITEDDAKALFAGNVGKTELTPEELNNVTGGGTCNRYNEDKCKSPEGRPCSGGGTPCDHYSTTEFNRNLYNVQIRVQCNKGCFKPYEYTKDLTLYPHV